VLVYDYLQVRLDMMYYFHRYYDGVGEIRPRRVSGGGGA
jgi:hypothetical protein